VLFHGTKKGGTVMDCTAEKEKLVIVVVIVDIDDVLLLLLVGIIAITLTGELYEVAGGANLRETEENEVVSAALDVGVGKGAGATFGGLTVLAAVLIHSIKSVGLTRRKPQGKEAKKTEGCGSTTGTAYYQLHVIAVNSNRFGEVAVTNQLCSLLTAGKQAQSGCGKSEGEFLHDVLCEFKSDSRVVHHAVS
jgi:hypothetical protein